MNVSPSSKGVGSKYGMLMFDVDVNRRMDGEGGEAAPTSAASDDVRCWPFWVHVRAAFTVYSRHIKYRE